MKLDNSKSKTTLELLDGRSEELNFEQVTPTVFTANETNFSVRSGFTLDLDIKNVDLVAESKVLWPGKKIRVRGGIEAQGHALKASAKIPLDKTIKDGVKGESWLYWDIETPEGTFRNNKPIHMTGMIKSLPPKDTTLVSEEIIPLYDEKGSEVGHIYGCLQSN